MLHEMCFVFFITSVLSHFFFYLNQLVSFRKDFILDFLNPDFFSTCEMAFILTGMSFAHKNKE